MKLFVIGNQRYVGRRCTVSNSQISFTKQNSKYEKFRNILTFSIMTARAIAKNQSNDSVKMKKIWKIFSKIRVIAAPIHDQVADRFGSVQPSIQLSDPRRLLVIIPPSSLTSETCHHSKPVTSPRSDQVLKVHRVLLNSSIQCWNPPNFLKSSQFPVSSMESSKLLKS